jgi:hypothetical protein
MSVLPRCLLAVLLAVSTAGAVDINALLANPKLWSLSQDEFQKLPETKGFRWLSETKDTARAGEQSMTLWALPVVELVARFESGKLAELTPTIYARGDVGGLPREKYEALVVAARDALNLNTKVAPIVRGKDATNAVKADGMIWSAPTAHFLLEYSFTKEVKTKNIPFRAEFVRLEIKPPEAKTTGLTFAPSAASSGKRFTGPAHVKKDPASGDVVITDVPMVDQGQKGYCAVACAERMMRYYGVQTDANEIAQIANSDSTKGTSADAMFDALKKLSTRLKVRVRPVEQFEAKQLLALMTEYNRAAKRGNRAPQLAPPGQTLDIGMIFRTMDATVLKEVRTKNHSDVTKFQTDVQKHIDAGIPIIWSVMLGVFPEPGVPQTGGGHMRLIIGYNTKTQEIIFSDSWGAGHEQKRMPLDNAVTITTGLTALEPL